MALPAFGKGLLPCIIEKSRPQKAGVRKTVKEELNYFTASVRRGW